VKRKFIKSSRRLLMNDVVVGERREHVPHHLFTQRQYSNPLLVPHYIIELKYASTNADSECLATKHSIKGLPLLSTLSSLSFPMSFPYNFMHLIWTNLIPNLILFWAEKFKDISHHDEGYVLVPTAWEAIGEATVNARKTIPALFGSRFLNIASEKAQMIAKTHSIWTLYIAPTLLKGQFVCPQYYKHFMGLV
jgi:hypothetical protein